MLSHDLEVVEFLGFKMLYDIQVEETHYNILGQNVVTRKWLHLEDWLQLFEKLENDILKCSTEDLVEFDDKKIEISNNVEVEVKKLPLKSCHKDLFKGSGCELGSTYLQVLVRAINIKDLNKKINQLEKQSSEKKVKKESKIRSSKSPIECKNEYVPSSATEASNCLPYNPSKSKDIAFVDEPYSPKPLKLSDGEETLSGSIDKYSANIKCELDDANSKVTYKPSAIVKGPGELYVCKNDRYIPQNLNTDKCDEKLNLGNEGNRLVDGWPEENDPYLPDIVNGLLECKTEGKNDEKLNRTKELFGSEDSDGAGCEKRIRLKRKLKKSMKNAKRERQIQKEELAASKNAEVLDNQSYRPSGKFPELQEAALCTELEKKSEIICLKKKKHKDKNRSDGQLSKKFKSHKRRIDEFVDRHKQTGNPITLLHWTPDQLISTFDKHKPALDSQYEKFLKYKDTDVTNDITSQLNVKDLITAEGNLEMLKYLHNHYQIQKETPQSNAEMFAMKVLLPEWVLEILIREYNLSRSIAIECIKSGETMNCQDFPK